MNERVAQNARSPRELLYPIDKWTGYLWKKLKKESDIVAHYVKRGSARVATFESFAREIFARLYAGPDPHQRHRPEDAWARALHTTLDELPAWQNLQAHCARNKELASAGTATVLEHVVDELLGRLPKMPVATDPEQHREEVKQLLQLLAQARQQATDPDGTRLREAQQLQQEIDDVERALQTARDDGKAAAAQMAMFASSLYGDGENDARGRLRTTLRRALDHTATEVIELERAAAGLSGFGGATLPSDHTQSLLYGALRESEMLKKLGMLAGRLRQFAMGRRRARSHAAASELTDITSGNTLSRTLPHELLKLTDPLLQIEFLRAFAERSLLEYELLGNEKEGRGPMIVLIDDSDSMDGAPAIFARAAALALADVALTDKRAVKLVRFSHKLNGVLDMRPHRSRRREDASGVLQFLSGATDGGTNFELPLSLARRTIETDQVYERADVVLITDGEASLSAGFLQGWKALEKNTGLKTWAIHIGATAPAVIRALTSEVVELKDLDPAAVERALAGPLT